MTPLVLEQVDGVLRKDTAVPLGALVARVGAGLGSQVAGRVVGVVGDGLHELVVEINRCIGGEGEAFFIERVLQAHDTHTDRTVAGVGGLGGLGRVEVDVDDVVECADGDGDRLLEHLVIEDAILGDVGIEHHGAEVTNRSFLVGGVECDLGAEVRE